MIQKSNWSNKDYVKDQHSEEETLSGSLTTLMAVGCKKLRQAYNTVQRKTT